MSRKGTMKQVKGSGPGKKQPCAAMTKKVGAFALFDQGKRPSDQELKELGLKQKTLFNYFGEWKKLSGAGPLTLEPLPGTMGAKSLAAPAGETTEATSIKLMPRVQTISLTPDIFISYMCAVSRGFPGGLDRFLSLAALDFWEGRGVDPYKQVSGIDSHRNEEG